MSSIYDDTFWDWYEELPEHRKKMLGSKSNLANAAFVAGAESQETRLATLSRLWRERPAGLAEYASHYGNGAWVREMERALGVEEMR